MTGSNWCLGATSLFHLHSLTTTVLWLHFERSGDAWFISMYSTTSGLLSLLLLVVSWGVMSLVALKVSKCLD